MSSWIVTNLWLIPAVPLAVSLVVLSLANPQRSIAALLAIFSQVVALILAIVAFLPTLQTPGFRAVHNFTWFTFGDQALRIGWMLDPLAAAMMVMITLVGLCIFVLAAPQETIQRPDPDRLRHHLLDISFLHRIYPRRPARRSLWPDDNDRTLDITNDQPDRRCRSDRFHDPAAEKVCCYPDRNSRNK